MDRVTPKYLPQLLAAAGMASSALVAYCLYVSVTQMGADSPLANPTVATIATITSSLFFYVWLILSAVRVYRGTGLRLVWMTVFTLLSATFVAGLWASQFPQLHLRSILTHAQQQIGNLRAYEAIKCHYLRDAPCSDVDTSAAEPIWKAALEIARNDSTGTAAHLDQQPNVYDRDAAYQRTRDLLALYPSAESQRGHPSLSALMLTMLDVNTKGSAFNEPTVRVPLLQRQLEDQSSWNTETVIAALPLMMARDIVTFGH